MSKNTITAMLLIVGTIIFFNSDFYKYKILNMPKPPVKELSQKDQTPATQAPALQTLEQNNTTEPELIPQKTSNQPNTAIESAKTANLEIGIKTDTIWVETDKFVCGISTMGAQVVTLKTKEYSYLSNQHNGSKSTQGHIELIPQGRCGGANLSINNASFDETGFSFDSTKKHTILKGADTTAISFVFHHENGSSITKTFSFSANSYRIGLTVSSNSLNGKRVSVGWKCGINESEKTIKTAGTQYLRAVHFYNGKDVEHIQKKKVECDTTSGEYKWVGLTSKYFTVALVPQETRDADISVASYFEKNDTLGPKDKKEMAIDYSIELMRTADGPSEHYTIYAGPSNITELTKEKQDLQKVLFNGWKWFIRADVWFPVICEWVLLLIIFLNKWIPDYGISIILITIITKVITYPLTQSSMRSMNRMKLIQPKVTAIRSKFKSNPKKMNEEIMKMYKQEGINPLNPGCLPMFLQMPVLFSLFVVLGKAIELRGAPTILVPWIHDLSLPEVLFRMPFEIPFYGSNFALMPLVMAVLTFFQNKMTIKDPNQKAMIYFMPIFMLFIFNGFSSGLVLYWTFSSLLGIGQQLLLNKQMEKETPATSAPAQKTR